MDQWLQQHSMLWFIFQGHVHQACNAVACQGSNEEETKDMSLVSSEKVL